MIVCNFQESFSLITEAWHESENGETNDAETKNGEYEFFCIDYTAIPSLINVVFFFELIFY